jgi:hypothetical protein
LRATKIRRGLEIAEHLLSQAATGERDCDRLKASAFNQLMGQ